MALHSPEFYVKAVGIWWRCARQPLRWALMAILHKNLAVVKGLTATR
jgi:hypothetical protein